VKRPLVILFLLGTIGVVFPFLAGRYVFLIQIAAEEENLLAGGRKALMAEMRTFRSALEKTSYLRDTLIGNHHEAQQLQTSPWIQGLHPPFAEDQLSQLARTLEKDLGLSPLYIFGTASETSWCQGFFRRSPLSIRARESLKEYMTWFFRRRYADYRISLRKTPEKTYFSPPTELIHQLGFLTDPSGGLFDICQYFLSTEMSPTFQINFPVLHETTGDLEGIIQLIFPEESFHYGKVMRRVCRASSNPSIKRSLFAISPQILPHFAQSKDRLVLYEALPGMVRMNLETRGIISSHSAKMYVLGVSMPLSQLRHPFRDILTTAEPILVFLIGWLFLAIFHTFQSAGNSGTIARKIAVTFLCGSFLPVIGLMWVSGSYLQARSQLQESRLLDFMNRRIEEFELERQSHKNSLALFLQTVCHSIEKNLAAPHEVISKFVQSSLQKNAPLNALFLVKNNGTDAFLTSESDQDQANRTINLFRGPVLEALLSLGSFSDKTSPEVLNRVQQRRDATYTVLGQNFDLKAVEAIFALPGQLLLNPFSAVFEQAMVFFLGPPNQPPTAAGIGIVDIHWPAKQVLRRNIRNPSRVTSLRDGFRINFHLYRRGFQNQQTFFGTWDRIRPPNFSQFQGLRPMVASCVKSGKNILVNNLDSTNPHLLAVRILEESSLVAVAYAVPDLETGFPREFLPIVLSALYAVFLPFLLAGYTAFFLTRPFPAFISAMRAAGTGDFRWQLKQDSGDEFQSLAHGLNEMAQSLHEKQTMHRFVSEDTLQAISAESRESAAGPDGSRISATILFSDIRGFTTLSEQNPPEAIVAMLNEYFTAMADTIRLHGGVIDKFIGDAMVVVFHERRGGALHFSRAVFAALALRRKLAVFNATRAEAGLFQIQTGVGIATGSVVYGKIGSRKGRLDFTVVGNIAGQAGDLETLSKKARHTGIILSPATRTCFDESPGFNIRSEHLAGETGEGFELITLQTTRISPKKS
jgi:class 3 adenylate cyclase